MRWIFVNLIIAAFLFLFATLSQPKIVMFNNIHNREKAVLFMMCDETARTNAREVALLEAKSQTDLSKAHINDLKSAIGRISKHSSTENVTLKFLPENTQNIIVEGYENGNLVFAEKEFKIQSSPATYYCKYDVEGALAEASYEHARELVVFNSNKKKISSIIKTKENI